MALRENQVKPRTPKQQPVLLYLTWDQAKNLTILRHGAQGHSLVQSDMWHWASHPLSKLIKSLEDLQHVCYYAKFHHHALFKIITTGMYNCYSQLPSEDAGRNKGFITLPMSHSALTHQDWQGGGMPELAGKYQTRKPAKGGEEAGQNSSRGMWRSAQSDPILSHPPKLLTLRKPEGGFKYRSWRWWWRLMRMGIMVKIHDEEHEDNSDDK